MIDIYKKMTNEEYREELKSLFDKTDNSDILRYFYILCSKKLEAWQFDSSL